MNKQWVVGKLYRISAKYPGRFIRFKGKLVKWCEDFDGVVEGTYHHSYSTAKEDYDPNTISSNGSPMHEEWEFWNNPSLNPEIENFWRWDVFVRADGVKISLPSFYIHTVEEYQGWCKI